MLSAILKAVDPKSSSYARHRSGCGVSFHAFAFRLTRVCVCSLLPSLAFPTSRCHLVALLFAFSFVLSVLSP